MGRGRSLECGQAPEEATSLARADPIEGRWGVLSQASLFGLCAGRGSQYLVPYISSRSPVLLSQF